MILSTTRTGVPEQGTWMLLHGLGGTGGLWRPLTVSLEKEFQVIAPDQRGHGKSAVNLTTDSDFTPLAFGRDLVETLDALGVETTWVLGHSMGVRSAAALVHLAPERVEGLVLVDLALGGPAGGGWGQRLADFLDGVPSEYPSRAEARAHLEGTCPDLSIAQYLMAVSVVGKDGRVTFPFQKEALVSTLRVARQTQTRGWVEAFARQGKPVWILRGQNSGAFTHEDFEGERAYFADVPSVRCEEVEGTGHGLPFEKRAWLAAGMKSMVAAKRHRH